ncbi:hypothetical protein [Actinokineospora sp.]|uniref:hypothetical protein n=1 Tax=Actinokineospora sp. TaxID=1872133 RepID=UPI003D6B116F
MRTRPPQRLDTGRYVGVDRSATAITVATTRNLESVAAGTARFVTAALGDLDAGEFDPFDTVSPCAVPSSTT